MNTTNPVHAPRAASSSRSGTDHERIQAIVHAEHGFVWRTLRRLGVPADLVEDATQQVFLVLCRRLGDIQLGQERSFLFGTSRRVASDVRHRPHLSHEVLNNDPDDSARQSEPDVERLLQMRRDREMLDAMLAQLPEDHRVVFVLYELEELTMAAIAELLQVPAGTVASRLRRAREIMTQVARTQLDGDRSSDQKEVGS